MDNTTKLYADGKELFKAQQAAYEAGDEWLGTILAVKADAIYRRGMLVEQAKWLAQNLTELVGRLENEGVDYSVSGTFASSSLFTDVARLTAEIAETDKIVKTLESARLRSKE